MRTWICAALLGAWGMVSPAGAADLTAGESLPVALVGPGAGSTEPTPLEWRRHVMPWRGQRVTVLVNGVPVPDIEWRSRNEVRVRTESGAPLTEVERQAIRSQALVCQRGELRDPIERIELNGTLVLEYDCARLQGQ